MGHARRVLSMDLIARLTHVPHWRSTSNSKLVDRDRMRPNDYIDLRLPTAGSAGRGAESVHCTVGILSD